MSVLAVDPPVEKPRQLMTPEEMSRLPDDGRLYELVNGKLVEKVMSDVAHLVAGNLGISLAIWSRTENRGQPFVEATFQCFPQDSGMVRRPDVAFVSRERLAGYEWGHAHLQVLPDLAVEVVSKNDDVIPLEKKIDDYLRAGVRRVWVVIPEVKKVRIYRAPTDVSELRGDAVLTDDVVLPGFKCELATLFAIPMTSAGETQTR